ncbi:MAG: diguanylate cyclase, partial [Leptolinea sp.]
IEPSINFHIAVVQDITERKQAEEALTQTRENYEAFFNTIDELLFVLDEQGNIIHCNKPVIDRLGYSMEELIGQPVLMVHPVERREEAGRIVAEMLSGKADFCPVPVMTKTGSQIPVETRVSFGVWNRERVIFGVTKDVSLIKLSEEKFSKVFYLNPSACGLSDLETGQYIEVNGAFTSMFGFSSEEVIGSTAMELGMMLPETRSDILKKIDANGIIRDVETTLQAKNGANVLVLLSAENIYLQDKKYRFTVAVDITERKRAEDRARQLANELQVMLETVSAGISHINNRKVEWANAAHDEVFGYAKGETQGMETAVFYPDRASYDRVGQDSYQQLAQGNTFTTELLMRKKDETLFWCSLAGRLINVAQPAEGAIWMIQDISERKAAEEKIQILNIELEHLALTDYLTNLYNRRYFVQRGTEEFKRSNRSNQPLSLLMVDIDEFKELNDTYGHAAGDLAIQQIAVALKTSLREIDILGRLGGDEFAVLLPNTLLADAALLAERIRHSIANMAIQAPDELLISAITISIGVAALTDEMLGIDGLLKNADKAMYRAKHNGRNRVEVY